MLGNRHQMRILLESYLQNHMITAHITKNERTLRMFRCLRIHMRVRIHTYIYSFCLYTLCCMAAIRCHTYSFRPLPCTRIRNRSHTCRRPPAFMLVSLRRGRVILFVIACPALHSAGHAWPERRSPLVVVGVSFVRWLTSRLVLTSCSPLALRLGTNKDVAHTIDNRLVAFACARVDSLCVPSIRYLIV